MSVNALQLIRIILSALWFFPASLVMAVLFLLRPFDPRNNLLYARIVCPPILWLHGIRVRTRHMEYLSEGGPNVVIANHQHTLDLFVFAPLLPSRSVTVGKRAIRWVPVFGWIFSLGGNLLIDRGKHTSAIETMREASRLVKEKNVSVFICPEGTRTLGKGIQRFKKGAFHLAVEGQLPIVPVVISSYEKSLDFRRVRVGEVLVEVLPPIPTAEMGDADVDTLVADVHARMTSALHRIDAELML